MAENSPDDASALNREMTALIADAGVNMGFTSILEYAVPGGRLDVVWTWSPPGPIPGVDEPIPVVGFEIESSWRTRKHVKGDLLNLQDAGVALGVIVLAGTDPRDDSLRRFATSLVDRPGASMRIWTEQDVRALANGEVRRTAFEEAMAETANEAVIETDSDSRGVDHTGKHRPLWAWLRQQPRTPFRISFDQLERDTGVLLPESCRTHPAHWFSYQGSAVARAIIDAGWHASQVDIPGGELTLVPGPSS